MRWYLDGNIIYEMGCEIVKNLVITKSLIWKYEMINNSNRDLFCNYSLYMHTHLERMIFILDFMYLTDYEANQEDSQRIMSVF